jgi:hypothetical protein
MMITFPPWNHSRSRWNNYSVCESYDEHSCSSQQDGRANSHIIIAGIGRVVQRQIDARCHFFKLITD